MQHVIDLVFGAKTNLQGNIFYNTRDSRASMILAKKRMMAPCVYRLTIMILCNLIDILCNNYFTKGYLHFSYYRNAHQRELYAYALNADLVFLS